MASPLTLHQVSVAILSCNRRDELRTTLGGLLAEGPIWREIIVADNGSIDGSVDMVRNMFPDVRVIETGGNLGVAGLNQALRAATGEWVLSVDDDSCADLPTWRPLADALARNSLYAAITCSVRAKPAEPVSTLSNNVLEPFLGFHQAGGLLRRDLIEQLGGFDESLFLWGVELHLTARAALAGFALARCNSAVVIHRATPLNRSSRRHAFHYCRNLFLLLLRHAPAELQRSLMEEFLSRVVLFSLLHRTRAYLQAIRDAMRVQRTTRQEYGRLSSDQFRRLNLDLRAPFSHLG